MRRPLRRAAARGLRLHGRPRAAQGRRRVPALHPASAGNGLSALPGADAVHDRGSVPAGPERGGPGRGFRVAARQRAAQPLGQGRPNALRVPHCPRRDAVAVGTGRSRISGQHGGRGGARHHGVARGEGRHPLAPAVHGGIDLRQAGTRRPAALSAGRRGAAHAPVRATTGQGLGHRGAAGQGHEGMARGGGEIRYSTPGLCRRSGAAALWPAVVPGISFPPGVFRLSRALHDG